MALKMPKFETEAEEARWWYDNREELGQEMIQASREGRLGPGSKARWEARMRERDAAKTAQPTLVSSGS